MSCSRVFCQGKGLPGMLACGFCIIVIIGGFFVAFFSSGCCLSFWKLSCLSVPTDTCGMSAL